jgi:hypothetical protein
MFPYNQEIFPGRDAGFKTGGHPQRPWITGRVNTMRYNANYGGSRKIDTLYEGWKEAYPGYNKILSAEVFSLPDLVTFHGDFTAHCKNNSIPYTVSENYTEALKQEIPANVRGNIYLCLKLNAEGLAMLIYVLGSHSFHARGLLRPFKEKDGLDGMECELDTAKNWGYNADIKTTVVRGCHYDDVNKILKATGMRITTKRAATDE